MSVRARLTDALRKPLTGLQSAFVAVPHRRFVVPAALAVLILGTVAVVQLMEPATTGGTFSVSPTGDDVPRLSPVRVIYEAAPAQRDPERLLRIEPQIPGEYVWLNDRILLFQPEYPGYERGRQYSIHLAPVPEAKLEQEYTQTFTATGALKVVQVIPEDKEQGVAAGTPILVSFSRGVTALTTLAEGALTAPVLVFDPPLPGRGEWVNTALYRYTPTVLPPNQKYNVRIHAQVASVADGQLADDFNWSFETYGPGVNKITPEPASQYASPTQPVTVEFNMSMDRASVQRSLTLKDTAGQAVGGSYTWSDDDTKLVFQPAALRLGTTYKAEIPAGITGRTGGSMPRAVETSFTTVQAMTLLSTSPANGTTGTPSRFQADFSNPVNLESFSGNVTVTGVSGDIRVFYGTDERSVSFYPPAGWAPSTDYTVRVASGATDRYGQPVQPFQVSFTTAALPSGMDFDTPGVVGQYSTGEVQQLYFYAVNTSEVVFTLYSVSASMYQDIARRAYIGPDVRPCTGNPIRTWREIVPQQLNRTFTLPTNLSNSGSLAKGYYCVTGMSSASSSAQPPMFIFSVADTALITKASQDELLVWAIDIATGQPVARTQVQVLSRSRGPANATTDADGLARIPLPKRFALLDPARDQIVLVDTGGRFGISSLTWQSYPSVSRDNLARNYVGHLYTDRPIYRTGETVELKGVIRTDDDATYHVPPTSDSWHLDIRGPRFEPISSQTIKVNDFGTFAISFPVPAGGALGQYRVEVFDTTSKAATSFAVATFDVIEFRKPEFEVTLSAESIRTSGDALPVQAQATYVFGGGVPSTSLRWDVTSSPLAFRPTGDLAGYSFTDYDPYRAGTVATGSRASGTGVTDALGGLRFNVPTLLSAGAPPQVFTISAAVTDQSAQAFGTKTTVNVFPADALPGVRPERYLGVVGTPSRIQVVTAKPDLTRQARQTAVVTIYERQWVTTKERGADGGQYYRSVPVDTLKDTQRTVTDDQGEATISHTPAASGTLRIVVEVQDDQGRTARSSSYLYVTGDTNAAWRYTNSERFELVADQLTYQVGDTAQILVPAPYPGAIGLVTIERGKNIRQQVVRFESNTQVIAIPIDDSAIPNIYVSVVLYRPPSAADPAPRFNAGTINLPIVKDSRSLTVDIRADRDRAAPRDKVRYDVKVTDSNGAGVSAEISLAVVDKAVLLLAEDRGPTGLLAFWFERGLGVDTASSLMKTVNLLNASIRGLLAGGTSKGGDGLAVGDPRRDFRNTAFWRGQVRTNDRGEASVEVPLPDNVTTWRMQVRAVTADARVGESVQELLTTTPLIVRPALPRFLRVGDHTAVRVLVRNATRTPLDATVTVTAVGATLEHAQPQHIHIDAERSVAVDWPAIVTAGTQATFTFAVVGDNGAQDAVEMTLPVYEAYTPETTATGGTIGNDPMPEAVYIPPTAILDQGGLTVAVRQSPVATLSDELSHFPPLISESTDYIVGRLLVRLGLMQTSGDTTVLGGAQNDLTNLLGRSYRSGGFLSCSGCSVVDPEITARALIALGDARALKIGVPNESIEGAQSYLRTQLDAQTDVTAPLDANLRAMYLYAIAHTGGSSQISGVIRSTWDRNGQVLSSSGRAYLLMAMDDAGIKDSGAKSLRSKLTADAVLSATGVHWEDTFPDGRSGSTIIATSLAIEALNRVSPDAALLEQALNWFTVARLTPTYESSWETGRYVRAVAARSAKTGTQGQPSNYQVLLNNKSIVEGILDPTKSTSATETLPLTALTPGKVNLLLFLRTGHRNDQLLYSALLRYQVPARGAEAVNRGFAVAREITTVDDPTRRINEAPLGTTVRVKVTVSVSSEQREVNVTDMLPSGFDPINPRLKTTDPTLVTKLRNEQRALSQASAKYVAPWMRWYYNPWDDTQIRDDRIEVHARVLPKGVYEFVYLARTTTAGTFVAPPTLAAVAGMPDIFGRGDSETFVVTP